MEEEEKKAFTLEQGPAGGGRQLKLQFCGDGRSILLTRDDSNRAWREMYVPLTFKPVKLCYHQNSVES